MLGPTPPAKTRFETCEKAVKGVCGSPQAIITASQWLKANSKLSNFSASADYQRLVSPLLVLPESMRLPVSKSQHQRHEIRRRQLHNVAKILVRYQETGEPITIGGATAMPWASLVPQLDHETIRAFFHAPASTFDSMTSLFEFTKSLTLKIDGIAYVLNPANVKTFRLWWEPNAQGGAMSDLRVKLMNVGGYAGFGTGIRLLDGYGSFHVPPELQDSTAHGKKDKLSVVARAMFLALLSIEEGGSSEKSSLRSTAWVKGGIRLNPNQSNLLTRMFQYLLKFDQPFSTPPELATIMKHFVVPQTNGPKEKAAKRYFAECLSGWQADDWQPDHPATVTDLIETNPLSEFLVNLPALDCFELLRRSLGAQSIDDAHAEERLLANSALIAESGCTRPGCWLGPGGQMVPDMGFQNPFEPTKQELFCGACFREALTLKEVGGFDAERFRLYEKLEPDLARNKKSTFKTLASSFTRCEGPHCDGSGYPLVCVKSRIIGHMDHEALNPKPTCFPPYLSLCEGCQWRECNRYVSQLKTRDTSDPSPLILIPTLPSDTKEQAECPGWGKRKGCRRTAGALSHRNSYETRDREGKRSLHELCAGRTGAHHGGGRLSPSPRRAGEGES